LKLCSSKQLFCSFCCVGRAAAAAATTTTAKCVCSLSCLPLFYGQKEKEKKATWKNKETRRERKKRQQRLCVEDALERATNSRNAKKKMNKT